MSNMCATTSISRQTSIDIFNIANIAVSRLASSICPNFFTKEDLEDIAQDAMLKACKSFSHYNAQWALSTWVSTIAKNCLLSAMKNKGVRSGISYPLSALNADGEEYERVNYGSYRGDEYDADREVNLSEFIERLAVLRDSLAEKNRELLDMIADEMPPREIAKAMGCTPGAAANRVCALRKQIREPLAQIAKELDIQTHSTSDRSSSFPGRP